MSSDIHQLVIGALNPVTHSYSVGSVDGLNFIACAIGSDVAILTDNFKQIQTIHFAHDFTVTAVNCCPDSGRIVICSGKNVLVYEPVFKQDYRNDELQSTSRMEASFPYCWSECQKWAMDLAVHHVHWVLDGLRLLVVADRELFLYQHKVLTCAIGIHRPTTVGNNVKFSLTPEDECIWEVVWSIRLAHPVKHLSFSHDGTLFATCGERDKFIKIWYQLKDSHSFSHISIQHPAPVLGFEWRRSGLMPRKAVHNSLITWCEDNTARIWKEIPSSEWSAQSQFTNVVERIVQQQEEQGSHLSRRQQQQGSVNGRRMVMHMKRAKGRLMHKLTELISEKRKKSVASPGHTNGFTKTANSSMVRTSTFADFFIPAYTCSDTLVFSLAVTISAENDCLLVPSMSGIGSAGPSSSSTSSTTTMIKDAKKPMPQRRPFTVHWLNNKDHDFIVGTRKILADYVPASSGSSEEAKDMMTNGLAFHAVHSAQSLISEGVEQHQQHLEVATTPPHQSVTTPNFGRITQHHHHVGVVESLLPANDGLSTSAKDLVDFKLERLLRQWNNSYDVLFSIHPLDGSLLTWTLESLDDPWKQPNLSFASRIPEAFPLPDTSSLSHKIHVLRPILQAKSEFAGSNFYRSDQMHLVTGHDNGSLNLWRFKLEDSWSCNIGVGGIIVPAAGTATTTTTRTFSIVNVVHECRLCGPSFNADQILAHPFLPLLTAATEEQQTGTEMSLEANANAKKTTAAAITRDHNLRQQAAAGMGMKISHSHQVLGELMTQQSEWHQHQQQQLVVSQSQEQLPHQKIQLAGPSTPSAAGPMYSAATQSTTSALAQCSQQQQQKSVLDMLDKAALIPVHRLLSICSPTPLPQYHPTQLMEMLNAGRIQRVRAILLNVLRALRFRQQQSSLPMFQQPIGGKRKAKTGGRDNFESVDSQQYQQRRNSISAMAPFDSSADVPDYEELDQISPLPLYALLAADSQTENFDATNLESKQRQNALAKGNKTEESGVYDSLFAQSNQSDELMLDTLSDDFDAGRRQSMGGRARKSSAGSASESFIQHQFSASCSKNLPPPINFTAKHSRLLTDILTHTLLPGLTSVDQIHLLAVADTISHFSTNALVDRLAQANATLQPVMTSSLGDSAASGYASAAVGIETVDECGLRFLIAKKQHEYLLRCLPLKQRRQLKTSGMSSAHIIWAFHSDTQMELLNCIPCCQRQQENWEEFRSYGIAWWLQNNSTLRICIEHVAKNMFQSQQNPLEAALFYLAMKKKNVLTQLFKTVNDMRMFDFFREDFADEKWKKAALKNAFVLMSKQRFYQAAAFFLLGDSLKDAIQTIISRIGDLQLALVILRLHETDAELQLEILTELLCKEILGCNKEELKMARRVAREQRKSPIFPNASRDPFERSMALWMMKEYVLSTETLLEEAIPPTGEDDGEKEKSSLENGGKLIYGEAKEMTKARIGRLREDQKVYKNPSLPDIFNFYSFLRRHPLVIRQKLTDEGILTTSTDVFLSWTRQIGAKVSPAERQLYLRTANAHLASGCPLLALDVLMRLPDEEEQQQRREEEERERGGQRIGDDQQHGPAKKEQQLGGRGRPLQTIDSDKEIDWSVPESESRPKEDKLELTWSSEEEEEADEPERQQSEFIAEKEPTQTEANISSSSRQQSELPPTTKAKEEGATGGRKGTTTADVVAQQLRLLATLSTMVDELNSLASGPYEVTGGQLRLELLIWLEREGEVLHRICDVDSDEEDKPSYADGPLTKKDEHGEPPQPPKQGQHEPEKLIGEEEAKGNRGQLPEDVNANEHEESCGGGDGSEWKINSTSTNSSISGEVGGGGDDDDGEGGLPPLHQALRQDRAQLRERVKLVQQRRGWLRRHTRLLHTLASYCALHSGQNVRLVPLQMEFLLLLLEVYRKEEEDPRHVTEPLPDIHSFPLLSSFVSSNTTSFTTLAFQFIADQCINLMLEIADFNDCPRIGLDFTKVVRLYNLSQALSSCVYQSLTNIDDITCTAANFDGPLTHGICHSPAAAGPHSFSLVSSTVSSSPPHWPGVNSLIALLSRRSRDAQTKLRLMLVELFVSVTLSLFSYALAVYDSRILFRLAAHKIDVNIFATVFGGAGEKRLRSAVPPPPRPQLPPNRTVEANVKKGKEAEQPTNVQTQSEQLSAIRAKLHAKVFGSDATLSKGIPAATSTPLDARRSSEQIVQCWIAPSKHITQYLGEKVSIQGKDAATAYDSDDDQDLLGNDEQQKANEEDQYSADEESLSGHGETAIPPHDSPSSYAWTLMRLALLRLISFKLQHFIESAGFDAQAIAQGSPRLDQLMELLNLWACQVRDQLEAEADGCPANLLPNMHVPDLSEHFSRQQQSASITAAAAKFSLLQKYSALKEPGNTPFEYEAAGVSPVRRLWTCLVDQENLAPVFVRYIFGGKSQQKSGKQNLGGVDPSADDGLADRRPNILNVLKLIHREHDPLVAFAVNASKPGQLVVTTGRELQELSVDRVLEEQERVQSRIADFPSIGSFLLGQNHAELDIQMQLLERNPLLDNDDYQLIVPGTGDSGGSGSRSMPAQTSSNVLNTFIVDRSRFCLQKMRKRAIPGIRRLESHGTLPYYASGSSDGSVLLWEWGVEHPLFVARTAAQHAKVVKLAFAQNGVRFAAVDSDGTLALWLARPGLPSRKPHFTQRCHNKFACDVKFLGQTSSVLVTAGHSTGDQNILIWDTLMPQSKAIVHAFVGHPDGCQCIAYQSNTQSIVSGGKHGEICVWDVRQRQLQTTVKAFDSANASVKCICTDPDFDIMAAGSSEGDLKIWSLGADVPQLLFSLPNEHASRGGFSLRQVGSMSVQGVQQIGIDGRMHLFSCGADNSLKIRTIPNLLFQ